MLINNKECEMVLVTTIKKFKKIEIVLPSRHSQNSPLSLGSIPTKWEASIYPTTNRPKTERRHRTTSFRQNIATASSSASTRPTATWSTTSFCWSDFRFREFSLSIATEDASAAATTSTPTKELRRSNETSQWLVKCRR